MICGSQVSIIYYGCVKMLSLFLELIEEETDKELFTNLFLQYEKQMWFIANKVLNDVHLSEDATQEAFKRIAINIKTLRNLNQDARRKYLLIAAKNAAVDIIKKEQKLKTVDIDTLYDLQDNEASDEIASLGDDTLIIKVIKMLPQKYSDVMYLHFVLNLSEKEIARQLDMKTNTVSQQIKRGRKMFVELYEREKNK